jgi:hypothetical protein
LAPDERSFEHLFRSDAGRRVEIRTIVELFRGDLPLGRAFWVRGIFGGGAVSLLCTLLP